LIINSLRCVCSKKAILNKKEIIQEIKKHFIGFKIEKFNKKLNYKKPPLKNNGGKKHKKVIFALS
jgi:hypothetical protein